MLRKLLDWHLKLCRHYADRTRARLDTLCRAATAYEARYAALPALRASPLPRPALKADTGWLTVFELEASSSCAPPAGPTRSCCWPPA